MSNLTDRYDTLIIRGSTSKEVPREAAGGEVVSWAAGHALAESGPLEEFVCDLIDGNYSSVDAIEEQAHKVLELSRRQRDHGWLDQTKAEAATEPQETVESLRSALVAECNRYNDLYIQHTNFVAISQRVSQDLAAMCEAYLAGDGETAAARLRAFAMAYRQNTKPMDGRTH